ncbi:hypothetical protein ACFLZ9_00335 [Patescibacteria group bacterium]
MEKNHISIEKTEINTGFSQKLTEAIRSKDKIQIIKVLKEINQNLTGLEAGHFSDGQGLSELNREVDEFFEYIKKHNHGYLKVYLGDGGLSRLVISVEEDGEIDIEVSRNSTDKVRKAWENFK